MIQHENIFQFLMIYYLFFFNNFQLLFLEFQIYFLNLMTNYLETLILSVFKSLAKFVSSEIFLYSSMLSTSKIFYIMNFVYASLIESLGFTGFIKKIFAYGKFFLSILSH